jgi:hypothetical protein
VTGWIKVEKCTPDKPELRAAARICRISRSDAFLAFFRLWSYFDAHCDTNQIAGLTLADLDDEAGVKGFGQAMAEVGWLVQNGDTIAIVNWERHNGSSAKSRARTMRRVQAHRARQRWDPCRNGDVTHEALHDRYKSVTREEKRVKSHEKE